MNANELADELDGFLKEQEQLPWGTKQVYLDQAATMLRQQQAEIAELKVMLGHYEDVYEGVVTHPVKELTDEEITAIWQTDECYQKAQAFARAILRKAQDRCNGFCGEYECKENQSNCKRKAQERC